MCTTEKVFFDTDCLSAFLWIKNESILAKLYSGRIVVPIEVYEELSYPKVPHLRKRLDILNQSNEITICSMETSSEEHELYLKLTRNPDEGFKVIGKGEAAAIALAKVNCGIVASNNLRDVTGYVTEFNLEHLTTGDILIQALEKDFITENEGNEIWLSMLNKRRKLPTKTFTDFLKMKIKEGELNN